MNSLTGHVLIAMPQMDDLFFARSVVYLLSHSEETGAMGLIINKTIEGLTVGKVWEDLKIEPVIGSSHQRPLHFGGPVAPGHAFVLHSAEYQEQDTQLIGDEFAFTTTLDILRTMAKGEGPHQCLVAIGYAGWGPGQLESEIKANGWLLVTADSGLVFSKDDSAKWHQALAKLRIRPEWISGETGQA
jgi:putative transcriptional regulator